jgi:hypothetical protein
LNKSEKKGRERGEREERERREREEREREGTRMNSIIQVKEELRIYRPCVTKAFFAISILNN